MSLASLQNTTGQLQPKYTKDTIKAGLCTPQGAQRTWIVVEDTDDVHVYERFFDNNKTKILTSENEKGRKGCEYLETIVKEILEEENDPLIFGIRDTDYTRYEDPAHIIPPSIFHTDRRDIEMMMLEAPSVQDELKAWDPMIPQKIEEGKPVVRTLGYMRICNHIHSLGCNFKNKVKVISSWDQTSLLLYSNWEDILLHKFTTNCNFSQAQFDQIVQEKNLEHESDFDICQGHDTIRLLQYMMIKIEYSEDQIMARMTQAYSKEDFLRSRLCQKISDWAHAHSVTVIAS